MKNSRFNLLRSALLLCLSSTFLFSQAPSIGLLLKEQSPFWSEVEKGAQAAAQAAGATLIVKAPKAETDTFIQAQLVISLVKQGVQAIVTSPSSREAMRPALEAASAKGIKIVIIDSALEGVPGSVFVGTDQTAAGQAAGALLKGLIGEKDEFGILKHTQGNAATSNRENGALAVLREAYPALVSHGEFYAGSEKGQELTKARLMLERHPKTKAILSSGTIGTLAMIKALEETKKAGQIHLVGFGYNCNPTVAQALESGHLTGWIAQLPIEVGKRGVEVALELLKGGTPPAVQYVPIMVITKDNLQDPKVQAFLK